MCIQLRTVVNDTLDTRTISLSEQPQTITTAAAATDRGHLPIMRGKTNIQNSQVFLVKENDYAQRLVVEEQMMVNVKKREREKRCMCANLREIDYRKSIYRHKSLLETCSITKAKVTKTLSYYD